MDIPILELFPNGSRRFGRSSMEHSLVAVSSEHTWRECRCTLWLEGEQRRTGRGRRCNRLLHIAPSTAARPSLLLRSTAFGLRRCPWRRSGVEEEAGGGDGDVMILRRG